MLIKLLSLSSILLLQCLTTAVAGAPTAQDWDDEEDQGDYSDRFPPYIEEPQPPSRPCDAQGCRDPTYRLNQDEIFTGQNIFLILFGRPGRIQSSPGEDIRKILTSYVEDSLPYFLKQLTPAPSNISTLVNEGAPLIVEAVLDFSKAINIKDSSKLKAWTEKAYAKAPCELFAAATLPVLEPALDAVYFQNNPKQDLEYGQKPTTHDLDYFIQPVFGPMSHRDGITIHYDSKFPKFQRRAQVANQGRDVFVRGPDVSQYRSTPSTSGNYKFKYLVLTLIRQFGHLAQWSAVDYLDSEIELQYLVGLCKAGYKYGENHMEQEACKTNSGADELLWHPIGKQFFEAWTQHNLHSQLGLPKQTSFSPAASDCSPTQTYTLNFEKGDLQINKCGKSSRTMIGGKPSNWTATSW